MKEYIVKVLHHNDISVTSEEAIAIAGELAYIKSLKKKYDSKIESDISLNFIAQRGYQIE